MQAWIIADCRECDAQAERGKDGEQAEGGAEIESFAVKLLVSAMEDAQDDLERCACPCVSMSLGRLSLFGAKHVF